MKIPKPNIALFSNAVKRTLSLPKQQLVLLGCGVLLAIGAVVFGVPVIKDYQQHLRDSAAKREARKNATQTEVSLAVHDAINNNQLDEALQAIEQNKEPESKPNLIQAATIYVGMQKYDEALEKLELAEEKYGLDSVVALNIAAIKVLLNDKDAAKEYFNKGIELVTKENLPEKDQIIEEIKVKLQELEIMNVKGEMPRMWRLKQRLPKKPEVIKLLVIVGVLVVGAGGYGLYRLMDASKKSSESVATDAAGWSIPSVSDEEYKRQQDESIKELENKINDTNSESTYQDYLALAQAYRVKGDYSKAIEYYELAKEFIAEDEETENKEDYIHTIEHIIEGLKNAQS